MAEARTRLGRMSDGRWALVGVLPLDNGGTLKRAVTWDHEPTHEELLAATRHMEALPDLEDPDQDQGHTAHRKVTRIGTFYYGHHWGPPTWWLPRIKVKVNRERLFLGVGWLTHAYSASYHPFDKETSK